MKSIKLPAPENIFIKARDSAVFLTWNNVEGADGYKLFYYNADESDKCIKTRYAQECAKTVLGFRNGSDYLAAICAFRNENGREILGEMSEKFSFIPISNTLKAQNAICLKIEETVQLVWEYKNSVPKAEFSSDDDTIATVDENGLVTAVSDGITYITISAENQTFRTKIAVNRIIRRGENKTVLMFTGDIMCTAKQQRETEKLRYDFHNCFSGIRDTISEADFTVGVLETMCHDGAPYESEVLRLPKGSPNCNSPSSLLTAIAEAGFDGLVTSTNHCCDTGREGLQRTVCEIKRLGMQNLGTMGNNPVIREINGIKIGLISCCMISNGLETEHFAHMDMLISTYKRDYFVELINGAMAMGAEYIVVYQHWGGMNSTMVRKAQSEEAIFMANAGADLIIGSHPHVIQKMDIITTNDGRKVPVAYSLGNFLTTMSEMRENRDSMILRVELKKDESSRIHSSLSYIPCYSEPRNFGASVEIAYPPYSKAAAASCERTQAILGDGISVFGERPKVLLSGSPVLGRIFSAAKRYRIDRKGILVSPISMFGTPDYDISDTHNGELLTELSKSFPAYVMKSEPDYIAVDFYTAAGVSCYRLGEHIFTGTKLFKKSKFYRQNKDRIIKLEQPLDDALWQEKIRQYAKLLLSSVPHDRIVLFRQSFSDRRADSYYSLRTAASRNALNKRMADMEDYFIRLVRPAVVDLSKTYITVGKKLSAFERDYFTDAYNAFRKITAHTGRRCVHKPDTGLWFNRVMKYYDSMTAKGLQGWLLDLSNAPDQIIAYTNKDFAAEHASRLIRLKQCGHTDLLSLRDFFAEDCGAEELIDAAEIIYAVQQNKLDGPYEFYELAFKRGFNIVRQIASQLSQELNLPVDESNAEIIFLLKGKPQLSRYTSTLRSRSVDVWGSALSRMALDRADRVHVSKYVFRQPQVFAFEPPVPIELPQDLSQFCTDNVRRMTVQDVFNRGGMNTVAKSPARWLVVDFFDLLCSMAEYKGSLFRLDDYITKTDFYKSIKDKCSSCYLFEKRDMKFCYRELTRFAEEMAKKYRSNIILIRTEPKKNYISYEGTLTEMEEDKLFDIRKTFLALCEERFISLTGCRVIDIARRYYAAEETASGSADTIRYEEEFYRQVGQYITDIIGGSDKKIFDKVNDEYIILRDAKLSRE